MGSDEKSARRPDEVVVSPREQLIAKLMERTHASSGLAIFVDPVILRKLMDETLGPEARAQGQPG